MNAAHLLRAAHAAFWLSAGVLCVVMLRFVLPANASHSAAGTNMSTVMSSNKPAPSDRPALRTPARRAGRNPFLRSQDTAAFAPAASAVHAQPVTVPPMLLAGTIRFGDGSYAAIIQLQGESRLLKSGQVIDRFTVKSIRKGQVKLNANDTTLTLRMVTP